ncbi:MAG: hypothetical protein CMH32_05410 [Micavibrio sp.]|nr:hypothetical protein [Micavibrio sp.]
MAVILGAMTIIVHAMGREVYEVEEDGWVRVADAYWTQASVTKRLTPRQKSTLTLIGRCPDNSRYRNHDVKFEEVFASEHNERLVARFARAMERKMTAQVEERPEPKPVASASLPLHLRKRAPF